MILLAPRTTLADRDPYLVQIGLRIRARRILRQVSQDDLAKRSGVSRVTLGNIERAYHAASITTYAALADGLGVDVGDLVTKRPD
jgi:transcriptional regulator with XRE-family HTH domain